MFGKLRKYTAYTKIKEEDAQKGKVTHTLKQSNTYTEAKQHAAVTVLSTLFYLTPVDYAQITQIFSSAHFINNFPNFFLLSSFGSQVIAFQMNDPEIFSCSTINDITFSINNHSHRNCYYAVLTKLSYSFYSLLIRGTFFPLDFFFAVFFQRFSCGCPFIFIFHVFPLHFRLLKFF